MLMPITPQSMSPPQMKSLLAQATMRLPPLFVILPVAKVEANISLR